MIDNVNFDYAIDVGFTEDYKPDFTTLENEFLDIKGLSPEKKMTIVMLRRYVGNRKSTSGEIVPNDKGGFPSIGTLCETCGTSRPTVIKSIDFFIWMKWVVKRGSYNHENNTRGVNTYLINVPVIKEQIKLFKEKNITFNEIEEYFNRLYQYKDSTNPENDGKNILNKGCIFIANSYSKELVQDILQPYKKAPKKSSKKNK